MFPLRAIIAEVRGIRAEYHHEDLRLLKLQHRPWLRDVIHGEVQLDDDWLPTGIEIGWRENDGH